MSAPVPQPELQHPRRGRPPTPGLREDILRAAEIIFTRHDYHEVQMDEVAEACGVGKGTLYRYFPGKHALYVAVMFEGIARLREELAAAVGTSEPAARKIRGIVRGTLAHFWDRRFFFSLIHQNEHKPDAAAREWFRQRQALARLVQDALENAMAAGPIPPAAARIPTELLLGMMRGVNRDRAKDDRLEDLGTAAVDIFMRGAGTPAGRQVPAQARRACG